MSTKKVKPVSVKVEKNSSYPNPSDWIKNPKHLKRSTVAYDSIAYRKLTHFTVDSKIITYDLSGFGAEDKITLEAPENKENRADVYIHVILFGSTIVLSQLDFSELDTQYTHWLKFEDEKKKYTIDIMATTIDLCISSTEHLDSKWKIIGLHCNLLIVPEYNKNTRLHACFSLHNNLNKSLQKNQDGVSACYFNELKVLATNYENVYQSHNKGTVLQSFFASNDPIYSLPNHYSKKYITQNTVEVAIENLDDPHANTNNVYVKMAHQHTMCKFLSYLISREKQGIRLSLGTSESQPEHIDVSMLKFFDLVEVINNTAQSEYQNLSLDELSNQSNLKNQLSALKKINPILLDIFGSSRIAEIINSRTYFSDLVKDFNGNNRDESLHNIFHEKDNQVMMTLNTLSLISHKREDFSGNDAQKPVPKDINLSQDLVLDYNDPIVAYRIEQDSLLNFLEQNPVVSDYYLFLYGYWNNKMKDSNDYKSIDHSIDKIEAASRHEILPSISYQIDYLNRLKSPILPIYNLIKLTDFSRYYTDSIRSQLSSIALNPFSKKAQDDNKNLYLSCRNMRNSIIEFQTVIDRSKKISKNERTRFEEEIVSNDFQCNVDILSRIFSDFYDLTNYYTNFFAGNSIELSGLRASKLNDLLNSGLSLVNHDEILNAIKLSETNVIGAIDKIKENFDTYIQSIQKYNHTMHDTFEALVENNAANFEVLCAGTKRIFEEIEKLKIETNEHYDKFVVEYKKEALKEQDNDSARRNKSTAMFIFEGILKGCKAAEAFAEGKVLNGIENLYGAFKSFDSIMHYSNDLKAIPEKDKMKGFIDYDFQDDFKSITEAEIKNHFIKVTSEVSVFDEFAVTYRQTVTDDLQKMSNLAVQSLKLRDKHIELQSKDYFLRNKLIAIDQFSTQLAQITSDTKDEKKSAEELDKAFYLMEQIKQIEFNNKMHRLVILNKYKIVKQYEENSKIFDFSTIRSFNDITPSQLGIWKASIDRCTSNKVKNTKNKTLLFDIKLGSLINGHTVGYEAILERFNRKQQFLRITTINFDAYNPHISSTTKDEDLALKWTFSDKIYDNNFDPKSKEHLVYLVEPYGSNNHVSLSKEADFSKIAKKNGILPKERYSPSPFADWFVKIEKPSFNYDENTEITLRMNITYTYSIGEE